MTRYPLSTPAHCRHRCENCGRVVTFRDLDAGRAELEDLNPDDVTAHHTYECWRTPLRRGTHA